ncbi:MAG: gluconokinase [Chitinophagaceae bacterium]
MKYIIGIDIGTTHTKAIIVGIDGKVIYEDKSSYPLYQPSPGFQEQNPEDIYAACIKVLSAAVSAIDDQYEIAGVSFSAAMHGFMAVDENNHPLTPFITWADIRSQAYALSLKETVLGKQLHRETGTAIHPMSPLCKIAWLKNEQPDIYRKTAKFISIKEFIFYRLFNAYLIDYSIASATGMFQTMKLDWYRQALEWLGIEPDKLSKPVPTHHIEILSNESLKKQLGLTVSLPFIIGSSDGCLAVLGSGATLPNEVALTIGTSGAVRKTVTKLVDDPEQRLFTYILQEGWYVSGGASNNGGNIPKWFSEQMLDRSFDSDDAFQWFMDQSSSVPPGAEGLLCLPYIYGERSPVWDAAAKGMFSGMTGAHHKAHFMRAILEGICYSLKEILRALEECDAPVDTIYASGGFIKSALWLQILSDITGKKILVSHEGDASALGAAFMGMAATGLIKDLSQVKQLTRTGEVITPGDDNRQIYERGYSIFRKLIQAERDLRRKV